MFLRAIGVATFGHFGAEGSGSRAAAGRAPAPPGLRLLLPLARPYPSAARGGAQKLKPRRDGRLQSPIISISPGKRWSLLLGLRRFVP